MQQQNNSPKFDRLTSGMFPTEEVAVKLEDAKSNIEH